ncbi:MAG: hypothetical protein EPO24_12995 [Bacteroidetes bacterium]|nr:MAG: hypothetical protein EPO24_12995 [Bacteroidota bacterium]
MKHRYVWYLLILLYSVADVQVAVAQWYNEPLTIQGLERTTRHSAASRAAGGITIGIQNQAGTMFSNPASLQSVTTYQVSLSGLNTDAGASQVQQYSPLKYYSNFSLLMEGLTGYIDDPDTSLPGANPGDTVQRPYDAIGPNWSSSKTTGARPEIFLAVPFSLDEMELTFGVGLVDYSTLNHHYENHNVLFPSIGSERPVPVSRPASDSVPFITHWSSLLRQREGYIRGYGAALSGSFAGSFSWGLSGMILSGTSDDYEEKIERGTLTFYRDWFRLDSVYGQRKTIGTSEYQGFEFSIGGIYRGTHVSTGVTVKLPMTITRKYSRVERFDTTGSASLVTVEGEDAITLPWRGSIGISLQARENVTIGVEYEIQSYSSALYKDAAGRESHPWLSSSMLRAGVEYRPLDWLAVRGGAREQTEIFEAEGNALIGEPVSYSLYSGGLGITYESLRLNVSYEYGLRKYQDVWQTNVNFNEDTYHTFVVEIVYELPAFWAE